MGLDIGTLTGRIELQDGMTTALMALRGKVGTVESAFNNLNFSTKRLGIAIAASGLAAVGAVVGIGAAIVNMATKGSKLIGVEDEFKRFGVSIEPLNAALKGTVDGMALMQAMNKSLGAGVKLTGADMKVLGETARAMSKAFGTDAAGALETLNSALVSGNTRALKRLGIQIDVTSAEKKFADSIGVTRDRLDAAGQLEAKRIAMLAAMKQRVDQMGVSEMSLAEKFQASRVSVENWFEDLYKAVARSTAVNQAFDRIKTAIEKALGADSQTLLNKAVSWIDRFATAVGHYGPIVIQALVDMKNWIVRIWDAVVKAWDTVPDWFKRIAKEATFAGGTVYIVSKAAGSNLMGLGNDIGTMVSGAADAFHLFGSKIKAVGVLVAAEFAWFGRWAKLIAEFGWPAFTAGLKYTLAPLATFLTSTTGIVTALGALVIAFKELNGITWNNTFKTILDQLVRLTRGDTVGWIGGMEARKAIDNAKAKVPAFGEGPNYSVGAEVFGMPTRSPFNAPLAAGIAAMGRSVMFGGAFLPPTPEAVAPPSYTRPIGEEQTKAMDDMIKEFRFLNSQGLLTQARLESMASAADSLTDSFAKVGLAVPEAGKQFQQITSSMRFSAFLKDDKAKIDKIWDDMWLERRDIAVGAMDQVAKEGIANFKEMTDAQRVYQEQMEDLTLQGTDLQVVQINRGRDAAIRAIRARVDLEEWQKDKLIGYEQAIAAEKVKQATGWKAQLIGTMDALASVFQNINSKLGQAMQTVTGALRVILITGKNTAEKLTAAFSAAASVIGSLFGNSKVGGVLSSTFSGAAAGSTFGPPGAIIGGIVGLIGGAMKLSADANAQFAEDLRVLGDYHDQLLDVYGTFENIAYLSNLVGSSLANVWNYSGDALYLFQDELDEFNGKMSNMQEILQGWGLTLEGVLNGNTTPSLKAVTEAAERYGLVLDNLGQTVQQLRITDSADQIVKDFYTLTLAGVSFDTLMTDITKRVTDTGASFDDMTKAQQEAYLKSGGREGGPGVVSTVTIGMHQQVQDMVTRAAKLGLELPETMRPLIQNMIDAGKLVDENGTLITDIGNIEFAPDLTQATAKLTDVILDLIDTIRGSGVPGLPRPDSERGGNGNNLPGGPAPRFARDLDVSAITGRDIVVPVTVNLDGRRVAKNQVRHHPNVLATRGAR